MDLITPNMAWIVVTPNPFEPQKSEKLQVPAGSVIRELVAAWHPETKEFPVPTICICNGKILMRQDWSYSLLAGDVVNFVAVPGSPVVILVISIVLAVASIAVALLLPIPAVPGETPESDPVYSTKGQSNAIRLGEPIEVCYGRNRIYPSYASRPFFRYVDNDQFQFSLFCLGQGYYDIHSVQIGDSLLSSFEEVEYEIIEPGETTDLFATNVYTSLEAGGQTLFAPNEEEYVDDGWVGPFPANPTGTETELIEVDLVMPKGLYIMRKSGGLRSRVIDAEFQYRLIDDLSNPLGAWTALFDPAIHIEAVTTTPQRRTYSGTVAKGRYEVRGRRTDTKIISHKAGHDAVWEGMRSFISDQDNDFGNVTLLAIKVRATDNLNERTQQRFNVIATRKLPIRSEAGVWSAPTATRSLVWALVDVFRADYGARISSDVFFDWTALYELDALYTSRGEYFDWCFRDPSTVWEAARIICKAGRAIPLISGSLITIHRDGPLTVPVAMFNQENIVQGSLDWEIKLWDLEENDSLRVEYTDVTTGYKQEQVIAQLPGGTSDNPKDIRLMGVQDRSHAYREGMYMLAVEQYLRENVTFQTGMEGYIPSYGDLIAVAHDVPEWGQGGYVVAAVEGAAGQYTLTTSEPCDFTGTGPFQIMLRGRGAQILGPFTALQATTPLQVIITSTQDIDFLLDGTTEPMLFLFGVANSVTKYLKVLRVEPQGGEKISITAVCDDSRVHSFDSLEPSPLGESGYDPFPPDLPEVDGLYVSYVNSELHILQFAWTAAFGASSYVVHVSEDGEVWTKVADTNRTSVEWQARPGPLWVRVAAINVGQGPWTETQFTVDILSGLDATTEWTALEWGVEWWTLVSATSYVIRVYDNRDASNPVLKHTATAAAGVETFDYDYTQALADGNLVNQMLVEVDALFDTEESEYPASLELVHAPATAPTNPAAVVNSADSEEVIYDLSWDVPAETDLIKVKVWVDPISEFPAQYTDPVFSYTGVAPTYVGIPTSTQYAIPLDSNGEHPAYYWRVAVFNVWEGNEVSSNITAEGVIPAYA